MTQSEKDYLCSPRPRHQSRLTADSVFVGIEPVGVRVLDDPKVFIADVVAVEVWGRAKASLPESLRRNRRGKAMGL